MVKEFPVPKDAPPLEAANQSSVVPALPVADSTTAPAPHLEPGVVAVIEELELIVATTATRVEVQPL